MNYLNVAQDIQALQEFFLENSDFTCKNSLEEAKEFAKNL